MIFVQRDFAPEREITKHQPPGYCGGSEKKKQGFARNGVKTLANEEKKEYTVAMAE